MREPRGVHTHYPVDAVLLKNRIIGTYKEQRGPGSLPLVARDRKTVGIIVPHASYAMCGGCMAWGYKALSETPLPDVYIIIGVNHISPESGTTLETFSVPTGYVRVDQELANHLIKKGNIVDNGDLFDTDPSVEVQLPFLLHAAGHEPERVKILPILLDANQDVKDLAVDLKECILDLGRNVIFIVSTNFTMHGPTFKYTPCVSNIPDCVKELDMHLFREILRQEPYGIPLMVSEHNLNVDGWRAIELLLHVLPKSQAVLEQYYTSGDVMNDYKNSVSFATFTFDEK
ncbi:AmmeMemoRadiSam system protein B [Candidatus Woesearchaeota archaeon]|nr:AmmeMemoRadiSam system protein B [Candidatus Woesearchaeota archaeon]